MKERILKLCKRLKKFSLDEICVIAEDIEITEIEDILNILIKEKNVIFKDGIYFYIKKIKNTQNNFLKFYKKTQIDLLLKCFCLEIPAIKSFILADISEESAIDIYAYIREILYKRQYEILEKYYKKFPQQARFRMFFDTKAYFYFYNNNFFVSENLLGINEEKYFSKNAVIQLKIIYSYLKRIECHHIHQKNLYYRLAEGIWRRNKTFQELYFDIREILFF